ncbi:deazaflavin-dependent oxidoreductase (nitroreductase family) [Mycolicibacterium sp. BK634]|uniref:nitroreductase family deazaflavin-dependent oxidoreductase n=1 Tax=Mycolicibacterium sp. BK634 TaxID=2587099 RepID=UPI0017CB1861|nr:deazaflavin-dependent oxidoreductase (nitroreductase family) [Mycolicibacterium sp. BK634]
MSQRSHPIRNSVFLKKAMKAFARAHIAVYRRTNGKWGAKLLWFPAALVTTTGRKSGEPRITATLYVQDGERVVLPASYGGRSSNPAWYLNLKADPKVRIQVRDNVRDMTARDATDDERRLYWRKLTRIYPPYKGYQEAADRRIPLVVCEPI